MNKSHMILVSAITVLAAGAALPCAAHPGLLDNRVTVDSSGGLNPPGDFTLEAWIRPSFFHFDGWVDSSFQQVICKWSGSGYPNQRSYLLALYQDQVEFDMTIGGTYENSAAIFSNAHLSLNEWVHIAGVYAGGTLSLYVNGQQDPQMPSLTGSVFPGNSPVYIGGAISSSYQRFHGGIDEVRISYVARYSGNFTPPAYQFVPDSDTALLMHMNEGSGSFTDNIGLYGGDGTLTVSSGWGEGAPIALYPPGDLNCDGSVDFGDINPFVLALTDWSHYPDYYPNCDIYMADINGDGYVDFGDINPFVALLCGQGK